MIPRRSANGQLSLASAWTVLGLVLLVSDSGYAQPGVQREPEPATVSQNRGQDDLLPDQAVVEKMEWKWSEEQATHQFCAQHVGGGYHVDSRRSADPLRPLTIRLSDDGGEVFSWEGHKYSVFVVDANLLYYAEFSPTANGCAVVVYDLKARKRLARTGLRGIKVPGHFVYNNRINMAVEEKHLVVYGNESAGRYIELLDLKTLQTVGHKAFPNEMKKRP
jgi:hypothetical protein